MCRVAGTPAPEKHHGDFGDDQPGSAGRESSFRQARIGRTGNRSWCARVRSRFILTTATLRQRRGMIPPTGLQGKDYVIDSGLAHSDEENMSVPVVILLISSGFVTFLLRFLFAISREWRPRRSNRKVVFSSVLKHSRRDRKSASHRRLIPLRPYQAPPRPASPGRQDPSYRLRWHL